MWRYFIASQNDAWEKPWKDLRSFRGIFTSYKATEEKMKPSEPSENEAKAKGEEGKKEGKTEKAPSAVVTKEAKASSPKKETAAKRKASSAAEAPTARVTRSRAAKK